MFLLINAQVQMRPGREGYAAGRKDPVWNMAVGNDMLSILVVLSPQGQSTRYESSLDAVTYVSWSREAMNRQQKSQTSQILAGTLIDQKR